MRTSTTRLGVKLTAKGVPYSRNGPARPGSTTAHGGVIWSRAWPSARSPVYCVICAASALVIATRSAMIPPRGRRDRRVVDLVHRVPADEAAQRLEALEGRGQVGCVTP